MLENIKLILGLEKNDYDSLITLFINKVTKRVKGYCNIENLEEIEKKEQEALNEFIEDKVSNIIAYKLSQMGEHVDSSTTITPNRNAVQSITRGSVSITYATSSTTMDATSKSSPELSSDEKEYLNEFRRCKFY